MERYVLSTLVGCLDEKGKARFTFSLLCSLLDSLGDQDKARVVTFSSWMSRLQDFDEMETDAVRNIEVIEELNEELQRILNDKSDFLNEIGLKESDLRIFMEKGSSISRDILGKTNFEEIGPFIEKVHQEVFVKNPDFMDFMDYLASAIDKHIVPAPSC